MFCPFHFYDTLNEINILPQVGFIRVSILMLIGIDESHNLFQRGKNMQNPSEITISINLLSGDPIVFKIEANDDRQRNAGARIEHSMNANYIGVELDGKLVIIPTNNIQKIEISPSPTAMISNIIKGAKLEPDCPAFGTCLD